VREGSWGRGAVVVREKRRKRCLTEKERVCRKAPSLRDKETAVGDGKKVLDGRKWKG
jgi:hypothetical protein